MRISNARAGRIARILETTLVAIDRLGYRDQFDVGTGQRSLAADADALDDGCGAPGAPGDAAEPGARGERDLHRRRVGEDLDLTVAGELPHAVAHHGRAGGLLTARRQLVEDRR